MVPRPSDTDYKTLKHSIKTDGQQIPITVNQFGTILDGHTRNDICKELKIKPIFEIKKFDDEFDERRFVITCNLSRRSLNLYQKVEVLYPWWKKQIENRYKRSAKTHTKRNRGQTVKPTKRLYEKMGDMLGCAHTIIYKITWLIQNAPEKFKRMLRKGTMTISTAYAHLFENGKYLTYHKKYRNNRDRYQYCLNCNEPTVESSKTKCHVHENRCCLKCGWGVLMLIKTNCALKIDEDYLDLVPRPTNEERQILKFSIMDDGLQQPIIANQKRIILDGHTRSEICEELNIKPKYVIKKFSSIEEERKFVILSNLARRNLSKFQKILLAWEIYENEKKRARERELWKTNPKMAVTDKKGKIVRIKYKIKEGNASEIFGKYMGTGHTVIHQVEWLKNNATKNVIKKLISGELTINRAYHLMKGIKRLPRSSKKPSIRPKECPDCGYGIRTAQLKTRKCHVHKWFCCKNCKWGV